jgi:hypothetical protein
VSRRIVLILLACVAGFAFAPRAHAQEKPCRLPSSSPLWIDFADGSVPFWQLFARPGVVAAASNLIYPPMLRAGGADTVYFDLYMRNRVGTPSAPADPAVIVERANKFYSYAAQSMDCSDPIIAENELFGAGLATPWSSTNQQYRANVLLFLQTLRARGAHPWLLVNSRPYTVGEAGDWWRQVADVAGIVREVYFPAPAIYGQGPVVGSRSMRRAFRQGVLDFALTGIPVSKLGIYVGFQTTKGTGGREGLQPASAWFETVKLQALAARTVAKEMKFHSIWSWGWAQWATVPGEMDTDKESAACVYLWTRDPRLCNGPEVAGPSFNRSRSEGQLSLPSGVRCRVGRASIRWGALTPLQAVTGDSDHAFSTLFARTVTQQFASARGSEVSAAEASIVSERFHGSWSAYGSALAAAKASRAVARGVIADELRRARIAARLWAPGTAGAAVAEYYTTAGGRPARLVRTAKPALWLGGRKVGVALDSFAPGRVQRIPTGRWTAVWSPWGTVRVRPLGASTTLDAFPLGTASASIRAALTAQAQDGRFATWLTAQEARASNETVCWRDQLPERGDGDMTPYLPFLELPA